MQSENPNTFQLIAEFESCSLTPYLCPANVWTIGFGQTYMRDGSPVTEDTPAITQEQADLMLNQTIAETEEELRSLVRVPLNTNQISALTSLIFNIGVTAFENSTLLKKLNAGDYVGAAEQFPLWVHAGGVVLNGLKRRREIEMRLFMSQEECEAA